MASDQHGLAPPDAEAPQQALAAASVAQDEEAHGPEHSLAVSGDAQSAVLEQLPAPPPLPPLEARPADSSESGATALRQPHRRTSMEVSCAKLRGSCKQSPSFSLFARSPSPTRRSFLCPTSRLPPRQVSMSAPAELSPSKSWLRRAQHRVDELRQQFDLPADEARLLRAGCRAACFTAAAAWLAQRGQVAWGGMGCAHTIQVWASRKPHPSPAPAGLLRDQACSHNGLACCAGVPGRLHVRAQKTHAAAGAHVRLVKGLEAVPAVDQDNKNVVLRCVCMREHAAVFSTQPLTHFSTRRGVCSVLQARVLFQQPLRLSQSQGGR